MLRAARPVRRRRVLPACIALATLACAASSPAPEASPPDPSPPSPLEEASTSTPGPSRVAGDVLEIVLSFGEAADLDLFVTGPDAETVYFGNSPARNGARLLADRRCDAAAPRREVVRMPAPAPGRYRVGVEYARSCRFRREVVDYAVRVTGPSLERHFESEIAPGRFEAVAFEFVLPPDSGTENAPDPR